MASKGKVTYNREHSKSAARYGCPLFVATKNWKSDMKGPAEEEYIVRVLQPVLDHTVDKYDCRDCPDYIPSSD